MTRQEIQAVVRRANVGEIPAILELKKLASGGNVVVLRDSTTEIENRLSKTVL